MKHAFFPTLAVLLLSAHLFAAENQYVKCTIAVKPKVLKRGAQGTLVVTLLPKSGIHINLTPSPVVTLDSMAGIAAAGQPAIPKMSGKPYLNPSKPITQPFRLGVSAKGDTANIRGTLTYFYCSDSEGWCSRYKQPIDLKVAIGR